MSNDEAPFMFKRSKKKQHTLVCKHHKYILFDEDIGEEFDNNNSISEDGIWVNINDIEEPTHDLQNSNEFIDDEVREELLHNLQNSNDFIDDEAGEDLLDSDMYSVRFVYDGDDVDNFINDNSISYDTTNDENADDEF